MAYRRTAEIAHERFAKGDNFVAEGYLRDYTFTDAEGNSAAGSEFIARKIGHDLARTNYNVDRSRRAGTDRAVEAPAPSATPQATAARPASLSI